MKTLYLEINQNEDYEFFTQYDTLSPLRKKIFRTLQKKVIQYPVCNVSQSTLAKWCGCSRSAVSEAFKLFRDWGWITLKSRGWKRPKTVQMPHSKQQIDVVERKYFKSVRATYRATHTYSNIYKYTSSSRVHQEIKNRTKNLSDRFSYDQKLRLAGLAYLDDEILLSSDRIYQENLSKGKKIDNRIEYTISIGLNLCKKHGYKYPWKEVYDLRRNLNGS